MKGLGFRTRVLGVFEFFVVLGFLGFGGLGFWGWGRCFNGLLDFVGAVFGVWDFGVRVWFSGLSFCSGAFGVLGFWGFWGFFV